MVYVIFVGYSVLTLVFFIFIPSWGEKSNRCSDDGGNEDYVQDYDEF